MFEGLIAATLAQIGPWAKPRLRCRPSTTMLRKATVRVFRSGQLLHKKGKELGCLPEVRLTYCEVLRG